MSNRLLILGLACLILLSGCKLVIKAPANGRVESLSGMKNCGPGQECTFDIVDLFFDDTFTGKGSEGFSFKQWKKRERGLCGANSAPCRLFTAPLGGNPLLLAILQSDQKFYLEPVFEPSSGTGEGPVRNDGSFFCWNPNLFEVGNTFTLNYRSIDKASGTETASEVVQTITGMTNFNGKQVLVAAAEVTVAGDSTVVNQSDSYFTPQIYNARSTNFGGTGETFVDGVPSGSVELEFDPGILTRYDLQAGQSYTQTYTTNTVQRSGGMVFSNSRTQTMTVNYIGVVALNILAGTYDACKFEERITGTSQGVPFESVRTYWLGVGIGVQIKEESEATIIEMESGSIDGKAI